MTKRRKTRTRREPASMLTLVEALTWRKRTEIPNMTTTLSIRVEMVASTLDSDSEATRTSINPTRTKKTTSLVSKWVVISMLTSRARRLKATTTKRAKTKMAASNLALVLEAAVTTVMTRRRRKTRTRREPASMLTLVEALTWTKRTEIPNMTTTTSLRVEMVASTSDSDSEATKTSISPT